MKNQYVGDIGDYGKYGLLRTFSSQCKIGVNWYLTENDRTNDGNIRQYLNQPDKRVYDPELYDALKIINSRRDKSVALVESANLIPYAVFYSAILKSEGLTADERRSFRGEWHRQALKVLKDAELVFCDPDNGPLGSKKIGDKQSEKYVSLDELADYYNRGQNVAYYCQKARRTNAQWEKTKYEIKSKLADASVIVLTFHGGTQRSYIFAVHPNDFAEYRAIADQFLLKWSGLFTEE